MDINLDEFNLLGGQTANFQNFMNDANPTLDIMQFIGGDANQTGTISAMPNFNPNNNNTSQLSQIQVENQQLKQQVQQLSQQNFQLQVQLGDSQKQCNQLQLENMELKNRRPSENHSSRQQVEQLQLALQQKDIQIQRQLSEYDMQINELFQETESLARERDHLKAQLSSNSSASNSALNPNSQSNATFQQINSVLNSFIQLNKIEYQLDSTPLSQLQFIQYVTENTTYLLKKQQKYLQEIQALKTQNTRIKEVCQQNLSLLRLRIEQIFNWRLNVNDYENASIQRGKNEITFKEVNGQLRIMSANCVRQGAVGDVWQIVSSVV
ncbi:Conserved_hypothetical protein [Hexamita inflata]|uniref:Uncharacterized protein n=1 Tax=Hexamita inflata TaxID=28002 RepID=A0ABP1M7S0_9EUKA